MIKAKDKGKGKGTKPFSEAKDTTKAKEVEAKTKEVDPMAMDVAISQPSQKEDPPPLKAKA